MPQSTNNRITGLEVDDIIDEPEVKSGMSIHGIEAEEGNFEPTTINSNTSRVQAHKASNLFIIVPTILFVVGIIGFGVFTYLKNKKTEINKQPRLTKLTEKEEINTRKLLPKEIPADVDLQQAIHFYKTGIEKTAERSFIDIIESGTKHNLVKAYAMVYMGIISDDKGSYNRAIDYFDRALKLDPKNYYAYYNAAISYRNKGLYKEAIELLNKAETLKPQSSQASVLKGILQYQNEDLNSATKTLEDVSSRTNDPMAKYSLALTYKKKGLMAEAKSMFLQVINEGKTNKYIAKASAQLGMIYAEQGDLENSRFYLRKAVLQAPMNSNYHYNYALVEYKAGNTQLAIKSLNKALKLGKDKAKTYIYIANLFAELGKIQRAENTLRVARQKFPANVLVLSQLADVFIEKGNWDEAIITLKRLYNTSTETADKLKAILNLGKAFAQLNDWDNAKKYLEKAIQYDNLNEEGFVALGSVYEKMGQPHKAISFFKDALKRNPDNIKVIKALASIYVKNKGFAEAEDLLTQLVNHPLKKRIDISFAYYELGNLYSLKRNYDTAIQYYEKVLESKDSYLKFDTCMRLAETILKAKKPAVLALPYLNRAISLDSSRYEARFLLAKALVEDGTLSSQEKADEELTAVIISSKDSYLISKALTLRGVIYFKQGLYLKALNDFDSALESDSANEQAFKNKQAAASRLENG